MLNNRVMGEGKLKRVEPITDDCRVWRLEHSAVWHICENTIMPSSFCLKWWQNLAEKQYGDRQMWLEIAYQLGYVTKVVNCRSRSITYEPYGFEYDGRLIRKSLDLPENGPLVFKEILVNSRLYQQLWDRLLK